MIYDRSPVHLWNGVVAVVRNSTEELGYRLTWGALRAIAICFLAGWAVVLLVNMVADRFDWRDFDATDDAAHRERSGLRIYHDHGTGCQYLATTEGLLTPRMDAAGKPMCGAAQ